MFLDRSRTLKHRGSECTATPKAARVASKWGLVYLTAVLGEGLQGVKSGVLKLVGFGSGFAGRGMLGHFFGTLIVDWNFKARVVHSSSEPPKAAKLFGTTRLMGLDLVVEAYRRHQETQT